MPLHQGDYPHWQLFDDEKSHVGYHDDLGCGPWDCPCWVRYVKDEEGRVVQDLGPDKGR